MKQPIKKRIFNVVCVAGATIDEFVDSVFVSGSDSNVKEILLYTYKMDGNREVHEVFMITKVPAIAINVPPCLASFEAANAIDECIYI